MKKYEYIPISDYNVCLITRQGGGHYLNISVTINDTNIAYLITIDTRTQKYHIHDNILTISSIDNPENTIQAFDLTSGTIIPHLANHQAYLKSKVKTSICQYKPVPETDGYCVIVTKQNNKGRVSLIIGDSSIQYFDTIDLQTETLNVNNQSISITNLERQTPCSIYDIKQKTFVRPINIKTKTKRK